MPSPPPPPPRALLLLTAYLGFISLGLPDTLLGVAWPYMRDAFGLHQSAAAGAFVAMGLAYGLSAAVAGRFLAAVGTGSVLFLSSALVTLAVAGYAGSPGWVVFLICVALHGMGSGAVDTGLNDFVSRRFAPRHMNWLHACYSLGAAAGPAVMTASVAGNGAWRIGYATVAGILAALTILYFLTRSRWDTSGGPAETQAPVRAPLGATLALPAARWHLAVFFIYAGIESCVGQWTFTYLTEARGFPAAVAGGLVTGYWSAILIGRILGGFLVPRFGSASLVRGGILCAAGAPFLLMTGEPVGAAAGLTLLGLALAPVFPCLMTMTPLRLGTEHGANAIGLQVTAATFGIAALPSIAGKVAEWNGPSALLYVFGGYTLLLVVLHEGGLRGLGLRGSVAA